MAGPKRNPLDFGFGERSFVQRFILAEILGPPRARSAPVAPPPVEPTAQDVTPPGGDAGRSSSG